MTDATQFREYNEWTGRKLTVLRRGVLDCGCPNLGEVFFHLWCDRLACEQHAEDPHECGEYAGVKSGTEEKAPEPLEAVPPATWAALVEGAEELGDYLEAAFARDEADRRPTAVMPICRGCRVVLPLPEAKLCGPCAALPSCGAERSNERTGRVMVCFRPAGHEPPTHEDLVSGSQWVGEENQVEALRPEGVATFTLDNSGATFTPTRRMRVTTADGEELFNGPVVPWPEHRCDNCDGIDPAACIANGGHPVDASSDTAPDVPARSNPFSDLYAALRARARRGGTK